MWRTWHQEQRWSSKRHNSSGTSDVYDVYDVTTWWFLQRGVWLSVLAGSSLGTTQDPLPKSLGNKKKFAACGQAFTRKRRTRARTFVAVFSDWRPENILLDVVFNCILNPKISTCSSCPNLVSFLFYHYEFGPSGFAGTDASTAAAQTR